MSRAHPNSSPTAAAKPEPLASVSAFSAGSNRLPRLKVPDATDDLFANAHRRRTILHRSRALTSPARKGERIPECNLPRQGKAGEGLRLLVLESPASRGLVRTPDAPLEIRLRTSRSVHHGGRAHPERRSRATRAHGSLPVGRTFVDLLP